ncbi:hypothetical protein KQX54_016145 [Cotesia glomerata]|uniref:Uncharacterized protein n=1 Tax=Cotesia glomerata TaxID=32391 RepID=A0AAV7IYS6_COTGL|nr:hypothetical protein KQX54_011365 [Cotesia glomerata]KAH0567920.1 hypothetical protein KQX54_016145 [Cotesia glomerata]
MEVTYSSENDPGVAEHVDAVINPETCPSTTTGHKKTQAIRQREYRLRMKEKSGPKKQKEDRPAKKSAAERQRECRLRKKLRANQNINAESNSDVTEILPRQDAGPSNYLTSVTTAQVVPSSPDDGPVITHHEVVIETAPVSTKKRQNVQQHESVSDVYKKKRKPNQTRNLNFDEICQLPSQPILTPRLLTNEMEILQPAENEFIENEDNINMSEESTSEPNSSLPYRSYQTHKSAHKLFKKKILQNSFGHACNVCDRLWFLEDLKCGSADEEILLKRITVK